MTSRECDVKAHTDRLGGHSPKLGACAQNGFFGEPLAALVEYGRRAERGPDASLRSGLDVKPWRAPKLHREGAPFRPTAATKGVPVGASITWTECREVRSLAGIPTGETEAVERSGQVWSGHWKAGVVWVAPEGGGPAVAVVVKTLEPLL